jgi:hypothetical protein
VPSFDMEPTCSEGGAPSTSASSPTGSPTASGSTVDTATDDIFVRHRVSPRRTDENSERRHEAEIFCFLLLLQVRKRDTLAGLAVKYNVTVS